jgi:hypothetical protein
VWVNNVIANVAEAWERSGSGSGKRERIFQKMVGSEASPEGLYIYIYIYIYKYIYINIKKYSKENM